MIIIAEIKNDQGQLITVLTLPPKEFKTGSRGFYANGKTEIERQALPGAGAAGGGGEQAEARDPPREHSD